MRIQSKVLFALILLWIVFCTIIYVGAHHDMLAKLLMVGHEDNQEILINQYAYTQIMDHYLKIFIVIALLWCGSVWLVLRVVFKNHEETLLRFHQALADEFKNKNELNNKILLLEKRAKKADQVDNVLHGICDHLNGMNTSLSLVGEKVNMPQVTAEDKAFLTKELESLDRHCKEIDKVIKSMAL